MSECISWTRVYEKFEIVFKESFNTDKKAHFDNMPDDLKVIDGAKGIWCNLLMLDAIIYILVNDSFNSSSRRAFNQHKVLCECIIDELERINPDAHADILESKRAAAVKGGKYLAISEALSEELASKYSHLTTLETMQYPWDTLENLRSSLLDGPPSKAKNKFSTIMELLMNNDNLAQFRYVPDLIVQAVIYRVMFVFKNHKAILAPLMSLCKKNKRVSSRANNDGELESRKKSPKMFAFPVDIKPSYSITSDQVLSACIPVQLAATLIPMPLLDDLSGMADGDFDFLMDCIETETDYAPVNAVTISAAESDTKSLMFNSQAAVEKAREASTKLALLKDKRVLKKLLKAQKATQAVIPVDIQRSKSDHLCAVIPVLPLSLFNPNTLDDLSSNCDSDEASQGERNSHHNGGGMDNFDQFFDEETFNLLVDDTSSVHSQSGYNSASSAVSDLTSNENSPRPPQGNSANKVKLTIDPATTKYILRDNVLCAIVPVSDPKLIAAAAAVHRGAVVQHDEVYQHTPGGRNMERSISIKSEVGTSGDSDTDNDSVDKCSLGPPLLKQTSFTAPPLSMHRFNSLYADDDESAEPLSNACTQSFISIDTFESFVF